MSAMEKPATYDDVNLILRLYELRREEKMRQARDWFMKSFHAHTMEEYGRICPPGSEENAYARMVTSYWEMVASFLTSGVLNKELFFQNGNELLFIWERIRDIVPEIRHLTRNPQVYNNLEIVAHEFIQWGSARAPEWHTFFQAMVRGA